MKHLLREVKADFHCHGPWPFWREPKEPFKKFKQRAIDYYSPQRNLDSLLNAYLPKTKEGHVAIGMGTYIQNRYRDLVSSLLDKEEQARIKARFGLRDIDLSSWQYFFGFKTSADTEFYVINAHEPHLPGGHLLLLPISKRIEPTLEESGVMRYKTPREIAEEAKTDFSTLVLVPHPGIDLNIIEKLALLAVNEPAWKKLGLTYEESKTLAEDGLIDGVEVHNTFAGKHNKEISNTGLRLMQEFGLVGFASSDTEYPDNVLTSHTIMNLDFSDPLNLRKSIIASPRFPYSDCLIRGHLPHHFSSGMQHILLNFFVRGRDRSIQ